MFYTHFQSKTKRCLPVRIKNLAGFFSNELLYTVYAWTSDKHIEFEHSISAVRLYVEHSGHICGYFSYVHFNYNN